MVSQTLIKNHSNHIIKTLLNMHSTKILQLYCKILQLKKSISLRDRLQILILILSEFKPDDFRGDGSLN